MGYHNFIEGAKDVGWIGAVAIPAWIINPYWIPPVLLWGGLVILVIRMALAVRDWIKRK